MFTIGLPFRGRPLPRRPWKLVQTSLKGKKFSGRIFLLRSVFCPKTFSLSRLYNGRRRQRKQATDGKVGTKEKQHTISRLLPVHMLSWNSTGGIFFESWMKRAGGKLRSLQKNQSVFFDHLPISAFVRSDVLCHFVGIQSGYLLSYSVVRQKLLRLVCCL